MGNTHLKLVTPTPEKRTVTPKRAKNADLRTREYLTIDEVERVDGRCAEEPLRASRRHYDFDRLPPRVPRFRGRRPSLGSGGFQSRRPPCAQGQARHAERAPCSGAEMRAIRRLQRETTARPVCFCKRAARAIHDCRLRPYGGARRKRSEARSQSPSSHAPTCLWLRPRKRGTRHPFGASLSRTSEHPAHGQVHRASIRPLQSVLELKLNHIIFLLFINSFVMCPGENTCMEQPCKIAQNDAATNTKLPLVVTRAEAAQICGISVQTFDAWVLKGILPKPLPGTRRWSRDQIERAISAGGAMLSAPSPTRDELSPYEHWKCENAR